MRYIILSSLLISLLMVSCLNTESNADIQAETNVKEPYEMEFDLKHNDALYAQLQIKIKPKPGTYFISPNSPGDYKGKMKWSIEGYHIGIENDLLVESPFCPEEIDPFTSMPAKIVRTNTTYTQGLSIKTQEDFVIQGFVHFVIEPNCTMEHVGFILTQKDGRMSVRKGNLGELERKPNHQLGGWYCPDNLNMFPPVNLAEWNKVPVIKDHFPSKEEIRTGSSLMYLDEEQQKRAKIAPINLPALATYFNESVLKKELIIVIQAVEIDGETIVGFRYLNGGNGSARIEEVNFVNAPDQTQDFVFIQDTINTVPSKIWNNIIKPNGIGTGHGKNTSYKTDWHRGSKIEIDNMRGEVTANWENMYLQLDYYKDGKPYVEKVLFLPVENSDKTIVKIVAGPFNEDIENERKEWNEWEERLKFSSENLDFLINPVNNAR